MTVFIAHAPADQAAAEALEKVIERRGQFVELDDGQTAMRPVQSSDVVILLISQNLLMAVTRLRLEQRALDAWAQARLVAVKLDHAIAPVGLRDLPTIDASLEAQREFKWNEAADAAREALRTSRADAGEAATIDQAPREPPKAGGFPFAAIFLPILALPGLLAIAASASIWLANRIGPTPGTFADLVEGIDAFGVRYGLPPGVTPWLFLVSSVVTLILIATFFVRVVRMLFRRKPAEARAEPSPPQQAPAASDAVFVSYARANSGAVLPVIEAAKQQGRRFWLDQQGLVAGDGWAGEIVRAIRSAPRVLVMCSNAAFESDHVKREIYLADRYQKQLVPVFIEEAQPPEDFEYFFAGVHMLNLFETPEDERPQALMRALG